VMAEFKTAYEMKDFNKKINELWQIDKL